MASEIFLRHTPSGGSFTLYMLIWKGAQVWNGTAFVDPAALARSTLKIDLTEVTWTGEDSRYVGDIPAGCKTLGTLRIEVYIRVGAAAPSDVTFGQVDFAYVDGYTLVESQAILCAAAAGMIEDADEDNTTIYGLSGVSRIIATNDTAGNRSSLTYSVIAA